MGDVDRLVMVREEIARADAKATVLLATSSTFVATLVAIFSAVPRLQDGFTRGGPQLLAWSGAVLVLLSALLFGKTLVPKVSTQSTPTSKVEYFSTIAALKYEEFAAITFEQSLDDFEYRHQLFECAYVAKSKYTSITRGVVLMLSGLIGLFGAVALEALLT